MVIAIVMNKLKNMIPDKVVESGKSVKKDLGIIELKNGTKLKFL